MLPSELSTHFLAILSAIYGSPKPPVTIDDLAVVLATKLPPTITNPELSACAHHLLETRKETTFPAYKELYAALQWRPPANPPLVPGTFKVFVSSDDPRWPELVKRFQRERGKSPPSNGSKLGPGWFFPPNWIAAVGTSPPQRERETNALKLLRHNGTLATRAVAERWAPALIDFVTANGREPSPEEERHLIAVSRRNDASVATEPGKVGEQLRTLRETMHQTAASRLGLTAPPAKQPTNAAQPGGALAASQRTAEQNLERLKAEALDPVHKRGAAP